MVPISKFELSDIKDLNEMEIRGTYNDKGIIVAVVVNKKSLKSYYVMIQPDTEKLTPTSNVRIKCSCQNFTFQWAAVLKKHDALLEAQQMGIYGDQEPKITNPQNLIGCCKHVKFVITNILKGTMNPISNVKGQI